MTDFEPEPIADAIEEFIPEPPPQVVIGVRFREASRMYHYSAEPHTLFPGDYVVVETARGEEMARVVTVPDDAEEPPRRTARGVKPILRQATREDRDRAVEGRERGEQIVEQMRRIAMRDNLALYPIAVQLNLAGDEGSGHFHAEEHVDFRDVVAEIEQDHELKLHMQHAGPRDRAKLVDGYDICGLRLCCASWMTSFPKVGVRTAKDQGLSLNPDSISGVCGRLLCCLTFEHEVYREMRGTLPRMGKRVSTPAGMGKVIKQNILQQYVTISLDDHSQRVDVPVAEIGLAVRTEDAPNQALVEAEEQREREQRSALRRAAAPTNPPQEQQREPAEEQQREPAEERQREPAEERRREPAEEQRREPAEEQRRESESSEPRRRRRRRRAVNTDSPPNSAAEQPRSEAPGGPTPPPRRRRARNPRRGPSQPSE